MLFWTLNNREKKSKRTRERRENQENNNIKHLIASKNVLALQRQQGAEKKVYCFVPKYYCDMYRTNPNGVLYSAFTSESVLLRFLCLALDCVEFHTEVVIRAKLGCSVYLSRVNVLQGNEVGQEEMAAAQQG